MHALFITGTDTAVGKTHAACLIARQAANRGWRVGAYKPVCSGAEMSELCPPGGTSLRLGEGRGSSVIAAPVEDSGACRPQSASAASPVWDDIKRLAAAINVPTHVDEICPQRFLAPLAPPRAARSEGRTVDARLLRTGLDVWRERTDLLLIEGAGGWFCPLTETETIADLAADFGFPVIVVARPGLGTINHTLLTLEAVRRRSLRAAGVILCKTSQDPDDSSVESNPEEIERRSGVPVFGTIPHGNQAELLHRGKPVSVDWMRLAES